MNLAATTRRAEPGLTAAAAVATTLAALTLWPVFTGQAWLRATVLAIVVVAVTGAAGRALRAPRLVVMALQLAAIAVLVTVLFAPENAALGFVPTSTSCHDLLELARRGGDAINEQTVPIDDVPGIVLLVTIGIGVAATEVDLTSVGLRGPAVSGLLLLAIYMVPVAVLPVGASWPWFAVGAVGWLMLMYVGRRDAVRSWGTVVTASRSRRASAGSPATDPRATLARNIALVAVGGAVAVAALVPGFGEGVVGRVGPRIGNGDTTGTAAVRLDLTATLESNLRASKNVELLYYRYISATPQPQYLRLAVLSTVDGVRWKATRVPIDGPVVSSGVQPVAGAPVGDQAGRPFAMAIESAGGAKDLHYLPTPYTANLVDGVSDNWQWDPSTATVFSRSEQLGDLAYAVQARGSDVAAETLAATSTATQVNDAYRLVPTDLPDVVRSTASEVTAGARTDYARAVRMQAWFRNNFTYDRQSPAADTPEAIKSFLTTNRTGYCQQFAVTYALMARSLGMPTRVVLGFTPGEADATGGYTVRSHDFHAWPEVWFDQAGWVRFEPTPRADSDSSVDVPAWSLPGPLAGVTTSQPTTSAQPQPSASAPNRPDKAPVGDGTAAAPQSVWSQRLHTAGRVGIVALLVLVAVGPGAARAARRRRRLGGPATAAGVEAAWAELGDTALDLGLPWSDVDTPRRTADALVHDAALGGSTAIAVQQLRRDVEQVRYAQSPAVTDEPARAVREVRTSLMARSTPTARWRSRLMPTTVIRSWRRR